MQIRSAYSPIRYPYYEITQGCEGTSLGINGSQESVGFGLSVRAERTGSPSGRTINYIRITTDIRNYLKDIKITR